MAAVCVTVGMCAKAGNAQPIANTVTFPTPEYTADFVVAAFKNKDYNALLTAFDDNSRKLFVSQARTVLTTIAATVATQTGRSPSIDVSTLDEVALLRFLFKGSNVTRAKIEWREKNPNTAVALICMETQLASSGETNQVQKPLPLKKAESNWKVHLETEDVEPQISGAPTNCM
jgi:hypothetical protein